VAGAVTAIGGTSVIVSPDGPSVREFVRRGIRHIELQMATSLLASWARTKALAAELRRHGANVVHAYGGLSAAIAGPAARRAGSRLVTTYRAESVPANWRGRRQRRAMAAGDRVVVESDFAAAAVRSTHAKAAGAIRLIPRGVDTAYFDPRRIGGDRLSRLVAQWRLDDGVPVVMMPGPLEPARGHRQFVAALGRLVQRNLCAFIVGDRSPEPAFYRDLVNQIARAGLLDRMHVIDRCRDMAAAYMLADVVVLPSTAPQSFDRNFAEAQAMGRPVVAADQGSAREQASDGAMVRLTRPGDIDELAAAIAQSLELSSAERQQQAPTAMAGVRDRYSQAAAAARMVELYRDVLALGPSSGLP